MSNATSNLTVLSDFPGLSKGNAEIWYTKKNLFSSFSFGRRPDEFDPQDLTKTHVRLGTIAADKNNLDAVYVAMQGESWSPNGEAKDLIGNSGSGHTSMSVGDIIFFPDTDDCFICDSVGWTKI